MNTRGKKLEGDPKKVILGALNTKKIFILKDNRWFVDKAKGELFDKDIK